MFIQLEFVSIYNYKHLFLNLNLYKLYTILIYCLVYTPPPSLLFESAIFNIKPPLSPNIYFKTETRLVDYL